ncbi:RNA polymerase sigma-70 factor, ECF subfamily [Pseudoalteromonas luteoviolacea B = ATCC 29581]|nr:RNA polymerase sigma-70 factor, ECF subfamily [Pseudoalteromonas luteoviolacea B = ATCC 29581]
MIQSQREKLLAYLRSIVHCPYLAEDVLQDTFLRLSHLSGEQNQEVTNPTAYCYQTARNIAIDMLRKHARENWTDLDETAACEYADTQENAEDRLIEQNLNRRFVQAVNALSSRHQHVLSLYKLGNFKQKDIAQICSISPTLVNFILQEVIVACQSALAH